MSYRTLNNERTTSTAHRLLDYDGACNNIHGHNMRWEVRIIVDMGDTETGEMPVDLKDVSDTIDIADHALFLNTDDEIGGLLQEKNDVITFEGDPTCEVLSRWMAEKLYDISDCIDSTSVILHETDKYSVEAGFGEYDRKELYV